MLCKYSSRTSIYLCLASAAVLPNNAGSRSGAERAGLYGSASASGLIETFRRWTTASLMKSKSCGSRSLSQLDCDRLLGFLSLLYFFTSWGLMFAKGQKVQLHRSLSGGGPLQAFILQEQFCNSSKENVAWSLVGFPPPPQYVICCLRIAFHFGI